MTTAVSPAEAAAMLTGSRVAFLAAASVWAIGFIATFWVRSPAKQGSGSDVEEPAHAAH